MSRTEIAKQVGALSVGATALTFGVTSGATVGAIAGINLALLWRDLKSATIDSTQAQAVRAVLRALEDSGEFREDDLATAAALLSSLPRTRKFDPEETLTRLASAEFVPETAQQLVALLNPDPETPAIAEILHYAFVAGLSACLASDQFRAEMSWDVNLAALQTVSRVEARVLDLVETVERTQTEKAALLETAVIQLAKRTAINVPDQASALAELDRAVGIAQAFQRNGAYSSNHPDFIDEVFRRVAALNQTGELDLGAKALEEAFAQEQEETNARQSKLLEGMIGQYTLLRDPQSVARCLSERVLLETQSPSTRFDGLYQAALAQYQSGRRHGIAFDLEVCIALCTVTDSHAAENVQRSDTLNLKGNALANLGDQKRDQSLLVVAIETYEAALRLVTKESHPTRWARTKSNLGAALRILGEQTRDHRFLRASIKEYQAALEKRDRVSSHMDWAATQNNLGNSHRILGELQKEVKHLALAVEAFERAAEVFTQDNDLAKWAMTLTNLGTALQSLGLATSDSDVILRAINLYGVVLAAQSREDRPVDWATTQQSLGNALHLLGTWQKNPNLLDQSLAAHTAALEVFSYAALPMDWAATKENMARVAQTKARLVPGHQAGLALQKALACVEDALRVFTAEDTPFHHAKATLLHERLLADLRPRS